MGQSEELILLCEGETTDNTILFYSPRESKYTLVIKIIFLTLLTFMSLYIRLWEIKKIMQKDAAVA